MLIPAPSGCKTGGKILQPLGTTHGAGSADLRWHAARMIEFAIQTFKLFERS